MHFVRAASRVASDEDFPHVESRERTKAATTAARSSDWRIRRRSPSVR